MIYRSGTVAKVKASAIFVVGLGLLVGCASSEQAVAYSEDTKAGFLASCSDSVSDSSLVVEVCGCFYRELEKSFEFGELIEVEKEFEEALAEDEPFAMPSELQEILAVCVVGEATLG